MNMGTSCCRFHQYRMCKRNALYGAPRRMCALHIICWGAGKRCARLPHTTIHLAARLLYIQDACANCAQFMWRCLSEKCSQLIRRREWLGLVGCVRVCAAVCDKCDDTLRGVCDAVQSRWPDDTLECSSPTYAVDIGCDASSCFGAGANGFKSIEGARNMQE